MIKFILGAFVGVMGFLWYVAMTPNLAAFMCGLAGG